ncbi:MAG: hypothetical protein MUO82_11800 [Candidatus Thermoplasmatota archaeon]|nr:hypothetical protein [Candidatus Thermoplasmatota archaeon]
MTTPVKKEKTIDDVIEEINDLRKEIVFLFIGLFSLFALLFILILTEIR